MEKEAITIRMPSELKRQLEQISKKKGLTINAIIVEKLWDIK